MWIGRGQFAARRPRRAVPARPSSPAPSSASVVGSGTAVATVVIGISIFLRMYPDLGFDNSAAAATPLNIVTASASPTTLTIMTWTAAFFIPIVLAYQGWTYWVFRRRLSTKNIPDDAHAPEPVA